MKKTMFINRLLRVVALFAVLSVFSGCASTQLTRSGFLADYDSMDLVEGDECFQAARLGVWATSSGIKVASVTWSESAGDASPAQRERILNAAREELAGALTAVSSSPVAESTDLELQSEITRFDRSNPTVNVVSSLALFVPVDNGGVCIEWQLVDRDTDQVLANGVASHVGKPWNVVSSFSSDGHAISGLKAIAEEIASYLIQDAEV